MRIKKFRQKRGLTRKDFGNLLGVSGMSIHRYETGRIPKPDVMRRIMEVTGGAVTPNDFYEAPPPDADPAPNEGRAA